MILLFILGAIGITHIVVDSKICAPVRNWFLNWPTSKPEWLWNMMPDNMIVGVKQWITDPVSNMLHCYQCAGFWCGLIFSLLYFDDLTVWQAIVAGGLSSFLSNFAAIVMNYFDAQTLLTMGDAPNEPKL